MLQETLTEASGILNEALGGLAFFKVSLSILINIQDTITIWHCHLNIDQSWIFVWNGTETTTWKQVPVGTEELSSFLRNTTAEFNRRVSVQNQQKSFCIGTGGTGHGQLNINNGKLNSLSSQLDNSGHPHLWSWSSSWSSLPPPSPSWSSSSSQSSWSSLPPPSPSWSSSQWSSGGDGCSSRPLARCALQGPTLRAGCRGCLPGDLDLLRYHHNHHHHHQNHQHHHRQNHHHQHYHYHEHFRAGWQGRLPGEDLDFDLFRYHHHHVDDDDDDDDEDKVSHVCFGQRDLYQ